MQQTYALKKIKTKKKSVSYHAFSMQCSKHVTFDVNL